jgi:transcriptional regulator with XRE-family HTH domain
VIAPRKEQQTDDRTRLAELRINKGVYQHELALQTGIPIASYRRLERGEVKNPLLWWYVNCAIALNVELEDVLDEQLLAWRTSAKAPSAPDIGFLADRYRRALSWRPATDDPAGRGGPTRDHANE